MSSDLEAALLAERYNHLWWKSPERDMGDDIAASARSLLLAQIDDTEEDVA